MVEGSLRMKVLIADDDPISRRLLESSLTRWGYDVQTANDGYEAFAALLHPEAPKLAVLDWQMPGMDGPEICRQIRQRESDPYTYIILLTGKRTQEDVVEGLDAGADDYVVKPFDPAELKVRLRTGKRILYLQDQLISAREALREQATHDSLTGLWNRGATIDLLVSEIARQKRHGGSIGIVIADLDKFKQINDRFGHLIGDKALCAAAQTMKNTARPYDCVGRFGGEEFLLILPGCDAINAMSHAERIRAAIEQTKVEGPNGVVPLTASLGVTIAHADGSGEALDFLRAADAALYRAKENGRNRVEFQESKEASLVG
jgi:two-component system cell cycle response regulator